VLKHTCSFYLTQGFFKRSIELKNKLVFQK
jgi:hypothetical protein